MAKPYDLSRPLVALDHDSTLVTVVGDERDVLLFHSPKLFRSSLP
jgi:hypothetical protein